jgi:hypothetical protein
MTAQIASAAIALFAAGACAGVIGVLSLAIRREDKHLTLTGEAPGTVTRAGRLLTGVGVRAPRRTAAADR